MQGACGAAVVMNCVIGLDNECFTGTQRGAYFSDILVLKQRGRSEMEFLTSLQSQGSRHPGLLQCGLGKYKDIESL